MSFLWTPFPSEPRFPTDCGRMATQTPSSKRLCLSVTGLTTVSYGSGQRLAPFLLVICKGEASEREQEDGPMKLANSLLYLVLTAGLAALAVTKARPEGDMASEVTIEDADPWFV